MVAFGPSLSDSWQRFQPLVPKENRIYGTDNDKASRP